MPIIICLQCRHYRGEAKCAAFPDDIPQKIIEFKADHREPYPGDNGIHFEPKDSGRTRD